MTGRPAVPPMYRLEEGALVLRFPKPAECLSINEAKGRHWGANARVTKPWNLMAHLVTQNAMRALPLSTHPGPGVLAYQVPVSIAVTLPFRTNRGRDPHNYTGTVVKALVDGITKAGLIPNDTPEWATIMDPTISVQPDKGRPLLVTVTITPRSLQT